MWIGALGTIAFGWVLALWVASVGRAAGQGLALAFAADVAIRAVFRTVDAPFSDSPWAAGIVALLAILALGGGWRAAGRQAEFGAPLRSLPLLGLGPALMVFMAFSGNFGQMAAPNGLDLRAALIWVGVAATAGLAWSSTSAKSGRGMSLIHVAAASTAMAVGAWLAGAAPSSTVPGLALVGLGLPVVVTALFPEDRKPRTSAWSVTALTVSGVLLVALLFIFYSFYAPSWVLPGSVAVTVVLALASSLSRHQEPGKRADPSIGAAVVPSAVSRRVDVRAAVSRRGAECRRGQPERDDVQHPPGLWARLVGSIWRRWPKRSRWNRQTWWRYRRLGAAG